MGIAAFQPLKLRKQTGYPNLISRDFVPSKMKTPDHLGQSLNSRAFEDGMQFLANFH
jgi:hypothetical protein